MDKNSRSNVILLTGSRGFIGKELLTQSKKKKILFKTLNKEINLLRKNSIKYLNSCNVNTIFHLAGYVPKKKKEYNLKKNRNNLKIFKNIISSNIENIILISTYAFFKNRRKILESLPKNMQNLNEYSKVKLKIERTALNSKKKILIIRIPGIYGNDRRDGLIYNCIKALSNNRKFRLDEKLPTMHLMHIDKLIEIFFKILKKANKIKETKILNLYNDKYVDISDVLKFIYKKLNKKPKQKIKLLKKEKVYISQKNFKNFYNGRNDFYKYLNFEIKKITNI